MNIYCELDNVMMWDTFCYFLFPHQTFHFSCCHSVMITCSSVHDFACAYTFLQLPLACKAVPARCCIPSCLPSLSACRAGSRLLEGAVLQEEQGNARQVSRWVSASATVKETVYVNHVAGFVQYYFKRSRHHSSRMDRFVDKFCISLEYRVMYRVIPWGGRDFLHLTVDYYIIANYVQL